MGRGVGSSPRVRGTVHVDGWRVDTARFIPACAGNSRAKMIADMVSAVHPRVCGEQETGAIEGYGAVGSSPRVRGTVRLSL